VIAILALVGVAYLVLQRQQQGPGATAVSTDLNRNRQILGSQPIYSSPGYGGLEAGLITQTTGQISQSLEQTAQTGEGFGAGLGAAAGPIGAAIGIIGSVVGGLLAAHTARVAGATAENSGINNIVPAFDADLREINAAYRAGQISSTMAVTYLSQVHDQYWQYMGQFAGKPGVGMRPCPSGQVGGPMGKGGCTSGQPLCDKGCTAGCCVGCSAINGSIANCIWAVQTKYHGPVAVCEVFGSKFGAIDRAGYQLSW
jgi:hypothetical protein